MKRLVIFFIILLFKIPVFGQKYLTAKIRAKADSVLKSYIGDTTFMKYCTYDSNTYYEYRTIFNKLHEWEILYRDKKTKGKFVNVDVRWRLSMPYPKCPEFSIIGSIISIVFDSLLRVKNQPDLNCIPDFYWKKEGCNLISKEKALAIARQQNLKVGIDSLYASIQYNEKTKDFTWEVSQILWTKKDNENNNYGEEEVIDIDAVTGEVLAHKIDYVGPVY